jgi:hypothetical protein
MSRLSFDIDVSGINKWKQSTTDASDRTVSSQPSFVAHFAVEARFVARETKPCAGDECWKPRQHNALPCTVQPYLLDIYFHFQISPSTCLIIIYPPCCLLPELSRHANSCSPCNTRTTRLFYTASTNKSPRLCGI